VLGELSHKWDGLTDAQRQNIAVSVAGTRRLNDFLVLMQRWGRAEDVATVSMLSQGSAARENEQVMGTLAVQVKQLKAAWQDLLGEMAKSGALDVLKQAITMLARSRQ